MMNTAQKSVGEKKRYFEFDLMRAVAMLLIVFLSYEL